MGEGSTEFLLSMFEDADNGLDMPRSRGSGAAAISSAWRPPPVMPRRSAKGAGKYMLDEFYDHLDDPYDSLDDLDDELLDDDDIFDDEFSEDDFFDDGLGFPPLGHQSPWVIIRRRNPFGTLNLPPIKRLRPGHQLPINSASSGSIDQVNLGAVKSPKRKTLEKSKLEFGAPSEGDRGVHKRVEGIDASAFQKSDETGGALVQTESPALTSNELVLAPLSSTDDTHKPQTCGENILDSGERTPEAKEIKTIAKLGPKKARKMCDLDKWYSQFDDSAPAPAKFAFEWFCEDCPQGFKLADVVDRWRETTEEERVRFTEMAEVDKAKFLREYEAWHQDRSQQGLESFDASQVLGLLEQKSKHLEERMGATQLRLQKEKLSEESTTASSQKNKPKIGKREGCAILPSQKRSKRRKGEAGEPLPKDTPRKRERRPSGEAGETLPKDTSRKRERRPAGYPNKTMTPYGIFCQQRKLRLAPSLAQRDVADRTEDGSEQTPEQQPTVTASKKGAEVLKEYRAAWNALSAEEREEYEVLAAKDEQRFKDEHQLWLSQQEDGGLGTEAAKIALQTMTKKVPKSAPPVLPKRIPKPAADGNSMDAILIGAAAIKRLPNSEPKTASLPALADPIGASSTDNIENGAIDDLFETAGDTEDTGGVDVFDGLDTAQEHESWDANETSSPLLPLAASAQFSSVDPSMPTPSGIPAAFGPVIPENDFIARENDLVFSGNDLPTRNEAYFDDELALAPFDNSEDNCWDTLVPDIGDGGGRPQLHIDADGKFRIDPSSTQVHMDDKREPIDMGVVNEAVKKYECAYPRTKATKWSADETDRFYEALSLYGSDLFLVQTCFHFKSAAEIKTKYCKEMKKHPEAVKDALTTKARRLTKEAFEKQHGIIDTSTHWVPPTSPEPGQEPEQEADDAGFPEQVFPPEEPEYTEADEADTTNRLMALFD